MKPITCWILEWEIDEEKLANATATTSFESLNKMEESDGFSELSPKSKSGRFFRRGEQQKWRQTLTDAQISRVIADHGDAMQLVGYRTAIDGSSPTTFKKQR